MSAIYSFGPKETETLALRDISMKTLITDPAGTIIAPLLLNGKSYQYPSTFSIVLVGGSCHKIIFGENTKGKWADFCILKENHKGQCKPTGAFL